MKIHALKYFPLILCGILLSPSTTIAQWQHMNSNSLLNVHDLFMSDSLNGYAVLSSDHSGNSNSRAELLVTSNAGLDWSLILSMDSVSFTNVAMLRYTNEDSIYINLKKNNQSYILSLAASDLSSFSQRSFNYQIDSWTSFSDSLYFIDQNSYYLYRYHAGSISQLRKDVALFDVNQDGIIYINTSVDSIFYCSDFSSNYQLIPDHGFPNVFGQNQSTFAELRYHQDTVVIKGSYPSVILFSPDNGLSWQYFQGGGESQAKIVSPNQVYSISEPNQILGTVNKGQTWINEDSSAIDLYRFHHGTVAPWTFAFGNNGQILRRANSNTINSEISFVSAVKLFPNPVKDHVFIENNSEKQILAIRVLDIQGRLKKEFKPNNNPLLLSDLEPGTYLLQIDFGNVYSSYRIIIN